MRSYQIVDRVMAIKVGHHGSGPMGTWEAGTVCGNWQGGRPADRTFWQRSVRPTIRGPQVTDVLQWYALVRDDFLVGEASVKRVNIRGGRAIHAIARHGIARRFSLINSSLVTSCGRWFGFQKWLPSPPSLRNPPPKPTRAVKSLRLMPSTC